MKGLREGFWPFANEEDSFPETWDQGVVPLEGEALKFAEEYAETEEALGRYSTVFGTELLPGMCAMPLHAVPKPNSSDLRLVNNHSAGQYALNNMISRDDVGMRQDNVQDLGQNLVHFRELNGDAPVWLFKSDVSNAYRLLPMHPLWQIKQVVTINGARRVDRNCCFGSRGSPDLWCTFMSLVLWIAINVLHITELLAYMDDNFGFDASKTLIRYAPYNKLMPSKQARLLLLWDELRIPHKETKQLFGHSLTIIGFHVDSVAMTITLPHESAQALVQHIRTFVRDAPQRRRSLREWQQTLGWINWGLNVQPLLRPALQSSYQKIAGKQRPNALIFLNKQAITHLLWVADAFEKHDGIHILTSRTWGPREADIVIYCDASLSGLGFWCPKPLQAFAANKPEAPTGVEDNIFWYEALTVLSALEWVTRQAHKPWRVLIYTDNLNTVQIFESLRANGAYLDILLRAIDILIDCKVDLRVGHIPGEHNYIALVGCICPRGKSRRSWV